MNKRRNFIKKSILGSVGASSLIKCDVPSKSNSDIQATYPRIISTWNHGLPANSEAWKSLMEGKNGISAIEEGVKISEADPKIRSVGYGGFPDRDGIVTLDACIMDNKSNCGSVSFLQNIKHPISVARLVMEETPHVMLSGKGALDFAISKGFKEQNLLTAESKKDWIKWKKESKYKPVINIENHDTISMLLIDNNGDLFGGCTTSGAAWKMHGRVGDSPIIGAGLFLDNEVGAAAATGLGEAIIRTSGSAMVVELMRQGHSPLNACKLVVDRISKIHRSGPDWDYLQVGFIAINKKGQYAGYSLRKGFDYAVCDNENQNRLLKAEHSI
ncbi:MAG: glycosylasparaginase [Flavobacteriaceae bacterium]|nr:glycosylasparaginase [Flavobacteriaceae bacterium]|tara:strand:+ start:5879 stop:6865 length:987 start_codon:yes stop_codon:yes gene_type:complete